MAAPANTLMTAIIGPGTAFSGDLETEGVVRIDGFVRGSVKTTGNVLISEQARVEASISAQSVTVGGRVKGNIYALDRVDLLPGAVVVGDIFASRFSMDDASTIHGDCKIRGRAPDAEAELAAFMARHGGFPRSPRSTMVASGGGLGQREDNPWAP
jgi:cytoskeletal protein CcmA (bactofilin family)